MKKKFGVEFLLLTIVSMVSLVSLFGVNIFEAYATVNSFLEDTTPVNIVRQPGNTTVSNSSSTITIGVGPNVLMTNGQSQTVTKAMNFASGDKLSVTPSTSTAGLNMGSIGSDPTSPTNGDVWINSFNNAIKYRVSGGTGIIAVLNSIVSKQTWTNAQNIWTQLADFRGSAIFNSGTIVQRNPASTFATTIDGGAVTTNQTLNLPAINGTDTLASLGKVQTFTAQQSFSQTPTFNSGINTAGNIASTASSGTFKITAPAGVAICIGTGC